jgi:hypothetical protein
MSLQRAVLLHCCNGSSAMDLMSLGPRKMQLSSRLSIFSLALKSDLCRITPVDQAMLLRSLNIAMIGGDR